MWYQRSTNQARKESIILALTCKRVVQRTRGGEAPGGDIFRNDPELMVRYRERREAEPRRNHRLNEDYLHKVERTLARNAVSFSGR
jgi:hypothetical protein